MIAPRLVASLLVVFTPSYAAASPRSRVANPCAGEVDALRRARERAVWRGARWMQRFLRLRKNLRGIRSDAVWIFLEIASTARSARLRRFAIDLAHGLARRLLPLYERRRTLDADAVYQVLSLLAYADELALGERGRRLARRVDRALRRAQPAVFYLGKDARAPGAASSEGKFDLLLGALVLGRARAVFPGRFAFDFGLRRVLRAIAAHEYVGWDEDRSPDHERFKDDAYLATHVAFARSDYGRIALDLTLLPRTWTFLRSHLARVVREKDIELTAEILDVARSGGQSERDDPELCEATRFLLRTQKRDGSWGDWRAEEDPYDAIHDTWTAVHGLRARTRPAETPVSLRLLEIFRSVRGL